MVENVGLTCLCVCFYAAVVRSNRQFGTCRNWRADHKDYDLLGEEA